MAKLPDGWIYIPRQKDMVTIEIEPRELVMCRNCRHWNEEDHDCNIKVGHFTAPPEWYCADGERRANDEQGAADGEDHANTAGD